MNSQNTTRTDIPEGDMLAARHAALMAVDEVLTMRQPLDATLDKMDIGRMPPRDRAFIRMMVATTLRRLGQIDILLQSATERSEPLHPPLLASLLRLGTAQLMFMNVPDYAVVDTSVRLADEAGLSRARGLVNAVLRRVAREGRAQIAQQDEAYLNTPEWLVNAWVADYGVDDAAAIAQANLAEAPLDISVKSAKDVAYWAATLEGVALPTGTVRRPSGGMITDLPGFNDGMWWVQDASAALPAKLLGDVAGKTVADLCAAPGGKSAQLAAAGANVIALDRSAKRLSRLSENMKRLRLDKNVKTEMADSNVWQPKELIPFVLLDAPCTATGTARRNPDVLRLKSPADMDSLLTVQARMLENAVKMLTPGGILIYCTCSLQKAEGEGQVEKLLAANPGMKRKPVTADEVGGMGGLLTPQGDVRVLPFHLAAHGGMDGFFISQLEKI